jgi:GNAT superfamily N-acetyltransferase
MSGSTTMDQAWVVREHRWDDPDAAALRSDLTTEVTGRYLDRMASIPPPVTRAVEPAEIVYLGLAHAGTTPAGHVALRRLGPDLELKRMYVRPQFRGTGLGLALLAAAESAAIDLQAPRIVLQTGDRQPEATTLYQRAGYRPIPIFAPYLDVSYAQCFEKRLAP